MELYIDTANISEIRQAAEMGVLDGVTTNPSLVAKEGVDFHTRLKEIVKIVHGPVSAEVVSLTHEEMIREAEPLIKLADNIVIKLPCTVDGVKACKTLSDRGIKTNMTLCFQPLQALMVAKAGAFLVSPFVGRVDDIAGEGMDLIKQIRVIYDNYGYKTKILAASIRHPLHMVQAATIGADVATVPFSVIQQMMKHPLTDQGLAKFLADWEKTKSQAPKANAQKVGAPAMA
ncbi:MAG TPA: fructose-6-phosphate aldolase [Phycisphaerales bacterium]|nr:fructose-6-phosphate aldolase [Phycisphaerales bacterium]